MKKFVTAGLLAMVVLALSGSQASAWICVRVGVGLDFHWQSGNHCFGWGLFDNGQAPAPVTQNYYYYPNFGPVYQSYPQAGSYVPYSANYNAPSGPSYSAPATNFDSTYQYANYPRPVYYYPNIGYGR